MPERKRLPRPPTDDWSKVPTEEKYCLIGAGFVGLGIAGALRRARVPFDCLEAGAVSARMGLTAADDQIGGNWYHGVYETVHIISSKNTTEVPKSPPV